MGLVGPIIWPVRVMLFVSVIAFTACRVMNNRQYQYISLTWAVVDENTATNRAPFPIAYQYAGRQECDRAGLVAHDNQATHSD